MNKIHFMRLDKDTPQADYLFVINELERQRDILINQHRELNKVLQSANRIMAAILQSQGGSITITDEVLTSLKRNLEITIKRDPITNSLQIAIIDHSKT